MTRPLHEAERIAKVRGNLERAGLLGLVAEVALAHHVELDEVLSRGRREPIASARHTAWTRVYRERVFSYPQIAETFDVDAASVRRGVNGIEQGAPDEPIPFTLIDPDAPVPFVVTELGEQAAEAWGARGARRGPGVAKKRGRAAHAGRSVAA